MPSGPSRPKKYTPPEGVKSSGITFLIDPDGKVNFVDI